VTHLASQLVQGVVEEGVMVLQVKNKEILVGTTGVVEEVRSRKKTGKTKKEPSSSSSSVVEVIKE